MRWPSNLKFWTPPDLEESTAPPRTSPRPVRAVSTMRLRRGNRDASSRMTSSVYRPLCSYGFAFRGGRFSVPSEVIRSGGDGRCAPNRAPHSPRTASGNSRCALRNGLRPVIAPRADQMRFAQRSLRYAQRIDPRGPRPCRLAPTSPPFASRATSRARSACAAQRESDHTVSASEAPGSPPKGWTLREVGGDAQRCEVRSTSRRTDTATTTRRGALRRPKCSSREALRWTKYEQPQRHGQH